MLPVEERAAVDCGVDVARPRRLLGRGVSQPSSTSACGCKMLAETIPSGIEPDRSDAVPRLDVEEESQLPGNCRWEDKIGAALTALIYILSDVSEEDELESAMLCTVAVSGVEECMLLVELVSSSTKI